MQLPPAASRAAVLATAIALVPVLAPAARASHRGDFRGICDRRDRGVRAAQQGDGSAPAGIQTNVDPDGGGDYPHDSGGYGV